MKTVSLNAVGKPCGANYDPNYKMKPAPTKISRLRKPYNFVDEQNPRRRRRRPKPAPLLDYLASITKADAV
jgi:hypothetical protein